MPSSYREARRVRLALLAPCLPNAVLVRLGRWAMVRLRVAAFAAFLILRRAAARCLPVAITPPHLEREYYFHHRAILNIELLIGMLSVN